MKKLVFIAIAIFSILFVFGCTIGTPSEVTHCQQETERMSQALEAMTHYPMSDSANQAQTDTCIAGYAGTTNNKKLCDYIKTADIKEQCLSTHGNARGQSNLCSNGTYTTTFGTFSGEYLIALNTTRGNIDNAIKSNPSGALKSLSDLTCLEYFDFLSTHTLDGDFTEVASFDSLKNLTNLRQFYFWTTSVSDLTPLSGMSNLEILSLKYNKVSSITPLANLTNLTELDLEDNNGRLSDISALRGLTKLQKLNLTGANIADISILSGITSLREVYLSLNPVTNFSPLNSMTFLKKLQIISEYTSQADCDSLKSALPNTEVTCYGRAQPGEVSSASVESIATKVMTLLPKGWQKTTFADIYPYGWSSLASAKCMQVAVNDPTDLTAQAMLYFCPKNWDGTCTGWNGVDNSVDCSQESQQAGSTARLVCDCKDYKIFIRSSWPNSPADLPGKINQAFN